MRGAAKSVDVNRPAELQLPRSHNVEQPDVCSARRQSFTEHVLAAAEGLSVWTVMHCTSPGAVAAFCDSGAVYKCHDLLTYLLKVIAA